LHKITKNPARWKFFGEEKQLVAGIFLIPRPLRGAMQIKRDYVATLRDPFLCHGHPCKENLNGKKSYIPLSEGFFRN
jgi:hypothetical protein